MAEWAVQVVQTTSNRTPQYLKAQFFGLDSSIVNSVTGGSEPFGCHFIDLDALVLAARRLRPFASATAASATTAAHSGVSRRRRRTPFARHCTGISWGSMRLQYKHGEQEPEKGPRRGGLQRHRRAGVATAVRHLEPAARPADGTRASCAHGVPQFQCLGGGVGQEHRPDASFGLQDNDLPEPSAWASTPAARTTRARHPGTSFEHYGGRQRSAAGQSGSGRLINATSDLVDGHEPYE